VPATLVALVLGAIAAEYLQAEEALRDLRLASSNVGKPIAALPKPDWKILEGWRAYHAALLMDINGHMPAADVGALHDLAARYPYPNVLALYAQASALNGHPAVAKAVLVHACKVHNVVVCNAMSTWWSRLGDSSPEVRRIPFPVTSGSTRPVATYRHEAVRRSD
jgi:hypothetical protein